ncbi:MAG TPA: ABC transporter ATP-binding protein [Bacteroidia bacterium]|jgi:ABC-type multidrug transport system fused ATPase/permease subunit|nr:ABC transporter ATP-binding protein [Bacteroidia bacterium]
MGKKETAKKNVWQNIFRLIRPYKKGLLGVFIISLLSTTVTLIQPLIYREAVNDIAGLFVQDARNDVKQEMGIDPETDNNPITSFFGKELATVNDTIQQLTAKTTHVKKPHKNNRVAPRTPNEAFNTLMLAVVLLFITNIIGLVLWLISDNMNVRLSSNIEKNFIHNTFRHVLRLPLSFFSKRSSAALHSQIDQSEQVSEIINVFSKEIFPEIISLVGIIIIMFWQNTTLAFLSLSIVPFYLIIAIRSTKKLEMSLSGYYEKWEEVSARMQDALGGIKTVKLSGAEEREVNRLDEQATKAYADYTKRSLLANRFAFWEIFLTHIATALVLAYGGYLALKHKLTPGDVVMFVAYLDLLYSPIDNLASIWASVQQNVTSIARAFKLLDVQAEEKASKDLQITKGLIEFKDVHFSYTPERQILKGLSLTAQPGNITAIIGTSGAGKTTTVDLMLKLFEPQSGAIFIDGQNLANVDGASVRRGIGMVSADGAIFRGTLADNIRYKKPDATDQEVLDAAIAAGMSATLTRLPDGIKTKLGENGFGLSVGEKQRVQIARVIVSKPFILIMDEATANLDYETEAEVKKTIDTIRIKNTVIIIAHRYSMVKDADYVVVLDDGKVLEEGRPIDLISKGGWFADFANAADEEGELEGDDTEDLNEEEEGED